MNSRAGLWVIFVVSTAICAWDVYAALRGGGNTVWVWALAIFTGLIALGSLRKLVRSDYSNSLW